MCTLAPSHLSGQMGSAVRGLQLPAGWSTGLVKAVHEGIDRDLNSQVTLDVFEAKLLFFIIINTGPTAARYSTLFVLLKEYLLIIQKIALWINVKVCYSLKTFITYFFNDANNSESHPGWNSSSLS